MCVCVKWIAGIDDDFRGNVERSFVSYVSRVTNTWNSVVHMLHKAALHALESTAWRRIRPEDSRCKRNDTRVVANERENILLEYVLAIPSSAENSQNKFWIIAYLRAHPRFTIFNCFLLNRFLRSWHHCTVC